MTDDDGLPYEQVLGRIAELAEDLTAHPDREVAEQVGELLDWVDAFHREGLGRLVEMVRAWRGEIFLETAAGDEIVGTLLTAYGLGEGSAPEVAEEAVTAALEEVRPLIESHGGSLEVESVVDGVVRVRMLGTCDGCPSSSATLTHGVEAALREHWPHFRRLEIVDPAAEVDPAKADLECVTVAPPRPVPEQLLQIRPYQSR
jgi:Fe-S cluster biogenesis protein NfuA